MGSILLSERAFLIPDSQAWPQCRQHIQQKEPRTATIGLIWLGTSGFAKYQVEEEMFYEAPGASCQHWRRQSHLLPVLRFGCRPPVIKYWLLECQYQYESPSEVLFLDPSTWNLHPSPKTADHMNVQTVDPSKEMYVLIYLVVESMMINQC